MSTTRLLELGFVGMAVASIGFLALALLLRGHRRSAITYAVVGIAWATATCALAASGALDDFSLPPPIFAVFVLGAGLVVFANRSPIGAALSALPLTWLVGLQSFRIFVELLLHAAVVAGVAPPQMTWTGLNFDMATGLTAPLLALALHLGMAGPRVVAVWNVAGLFPLATVVVVAVISMPTPLQVLQPDNTWVVHAPYILLPAVLVLTAVLLHVATFRRVRSLLAPPTT